MSIEMYAIVMVDGRKAIHYEGFIGEYCGTNERGDECSWSIEEGSGCGIGGNGEYAFVDEIDGGRYDFVWHLFENVQQYGGPLTDCEYENIVANIRASSTELDMENVSSETPCGSYWYEIEEE